MRCQRIQAHVLAFIEGDLHPRKQRRVAAHLATCPSCTSVVRGVQQTLHLVQTLEVPEPSPHFWETFETTLHQRLWQEAMTPPLRRRWHVRELLRVPRPVFAAIAVSLILVSSLPLLRRYNQQATPAVVLSAGEDASPSADLDFLKYLDLLEEVDVLEQLDTGL